MSSEIDNHQPSRTVVHRDGAAPLWPMACSIAVLWLAVSIQVIAVLVRNGGHFTYGLDDAYIHMAIAKNLVRHGVWGVTPYHFSGASSGPLWTLLIAATYLFAGVSPLVPFFLNLVIATVFLVCVCRVLARTGLSSAGVFFVSVAIVLLTPLPGLILIGEEHVLQAMLALLFIDCAGDALGGRESKHPEFMMLGLAPLAGSVRYEGLFLIGMVSFLFVITGRIKVGAAVLAAGCLPIVLLGAISIANGGFFFPASVLVKSGAGEGFARFLTNWRTNLYLGPHVAGLAILAAGAIIAALASKAPWSHPTFVKTILLLGLIVAHVTFAAISFFRYDAYLVSTSIYVLALNWRSPWWYRPDGEPLFRSQILVQRASIAAGCIVLMMGMVRGAWVFVRTPTACHNIFTQQFQMAQLVNDCYRGEPIALNDIGLVDYTADIRLLDLGGIDSIDVTRRMLQHRLRENDIDELARRANARIAILYPNWFDGTQFGPLPPGWEPVGSWKIPSRWMLGGDTVTFYAVLPSEANHLSECLNRYSEKLPHDVSVTSYTNSSSERTVRGLSSPISPVGDRIHG